VGCTERQSTARPVHRARGQIRLLVLLEREFFIDNLPVRIHFIIVMIRWTGQVRFVATRPQSKRQDTSRRPASHPHPGKGLYGWRICTREGAVSGDFGYKSHKSGAVQRTERQSTASPLLGARGKIRLFVLLATRGLSVVVISWEADKS